MKHDTLFEHKATNILEGSHNALVLSHKVRLLTIYAAKRIKDSRSIVMLAYSLDAYPWFKSQLSYDEKNEI